MPLSRKPKKGEKQNKQNMCINFIVQNLETRMESFEGRQHIVAPVILLVEGVHNGSGGKILYLADEIAKFPAAWNGIPLPVFHPANEEGLPVSANTPQLVEEQSVGRLWNVDFTDEKLKGEVWIDIKKAQQISPETLAMLQNDRQLEISTGIWFDAEMASGEWNGEEYDIIAHDFRPDHLALLPEGKGACSWDDGCGIRVNEDTTIWTCKGGDTVKDKWLSPYFNEISHSDTAKQLRGLLPQGNENLWYFVRDVFDDYFVYVEEVSEKPTLYKQGYAKNAKDQIELVGESVEVIEKTDYISVNTNKQEVMNMVKKNEKCCPEKVAALIANELSPFADTDKEWLEVLAEDQLDKLEPVNPEKVDHFAEIKWDALTKDQVKIVTANIKIEKEPVKKDDPPQTVDEYVANAPAEMQAVLEDGLRMHKEKKAKLIKELIANKRNTFTKEQLEVKKVDELEALVGLGKSAPADYTANAPVDDGGMDTDLLEIPGLKIDTESK